jgi:hypothetical protein
MRMSNDDMQRFHQLRYYVSVNIPVVRNVVPIIQEIRKQAGTIDTDTIKDALVWGKGPVIKVVKDLGAFGEFTPDIGSDEIRIDEDMVKEFEAGKGLRHTPKGQLVYLVGVTLLHELTHWADDQDGVDTPGEEGEAFERAIYGGVID